MRYVGYLRTNATTPELLEQPPDKAEPLATAAKTLVATCVWGRRVDQRCGGEQKGRAVGGEEFVLVGVWG
jgi:hypothetical protein